MICLEPKMVREEKWGGIKKMEIEVGHFMETEKTEECEGSEICGAQSNLSNHSELKVLGRGIVSSASN